MANTCHKLGAWQTLLVWVFSLFAIDFEAGASRHRPQDAGGDVQGQFCHVGDIKRTQVGPLSQLLEARRNPDKMSPDYDGIACQSCTQQIDRPLF